MILTTLCEGEGVRTTCHGCELPHKQLVSTIFASDCRSSKWGSSTPRPSVYKRKSIFIQCHLPKNILPNKCYDLKALQKNLTFESQTSYPAILFPKFGFKHGNLNACMLTCS